MFFSHWEYNLGNLYSQPKWKGLLDYGSNQFHVFNIFPQIEYKVRDNLSRLVSRLQSKFFFWVTLTTDLHLLIFFNFPDKQHEHLVTNTKKRRGHTLCIQIVYTKLHNEKTKRHIQKTTFKENQNYPI